MLKNHDPERIAAEMEKCDYPMSGLFSDLEMALATGNVQGAYDLIDAICTANAQLVMYRIDEKEVNRTIARDISIAAGNW